MGVGGFEVLGRAEEAPASAERVAAPADFHRLAYPQLTPRDFMPPPAFVDVMLPPRELRRAAVHDQNWLGAQAAAAARAEAARAAAVRSRPLELSVTPARAPAPAPAPAPAVAVDVGASVSASLSFYYCSPGPSGRRVGDGGGFCGTMRNGQRVHSGAAACAARYLGQRFRIAGDPTGRTYTCADTGSAVHGQHRDIWFDTADAGRAWQSVVGQRAVIQVVP